MSLPNTYLLETSISPGAGQREAGGVSALRGEHGLWKIWPKRLEKVEGSAGPSFTYVYIERNWFSLKSGQAATQLFVGNDGYSQQKAELHPSGCFRNWAFNSGPYSARGPASGATTKSSTRKDDVKKGGDLQHTSGRGPEAFYAGRGTVFFTKWCSRSAWSLCPWREMRHAKGQSLLDVPEKRQVAAAVAPY